MTEEIDNLEKVLKFEPLDHEGHARCVISMFPGLYKYIPTHGWLRYTGKHWEVDAADSVGRAIVAVLRKRTELIKSTVEDEKVKAAMVKSTAANAWAVNGIKQRLQEQMEVVAKIDYFDNELDKLNVNNGVINLRNGEIVPHDKKQMFTYCIPIDYNPDAYSDDWYKFLEESVSESLLDFLQMMAGYVLSGSIVEEVLFYIYGPSRSGKGTFTEVLLTILATLGTGLNFKTFTADRTGDTQNFDLAPLKGKRLVVAGESRKNEKLNEAVLKQVTGGDNIYCAHKGKPHFSFRPQFKIMLTSNHPASVDPTDEAAWGRLRVIHFPNSRLGTEDKGLKERLKSKENLEGILSWMVDGSVSCYADGLPLPSEIKELTSSQKLLANSVAMFIDQCCSVSPDFFAPGTPLYQAYKSWCKDEGYSPFGRKNFTLALKELGVASSRKTYDGKVSRGFDSVKFMGYGLGDESITGTKNG